MELINYSILFAIIIAMAYGIWWKFFKTEKFIADDYNLVKWYGPSAINITDPIISNIDMASTGYAELS
jgi:hypothetical protein